MCVRSNSVKWQLHSIQKSVFPKKKDWFFFRKGIYIKGCCIFNNFFFDQTKNKNKKKLKHMKQGKRNVLCFFSYFTCLKQKTKEATKLKRCLSIRSWVSIFSVFPGSTNQKKRIFRLTNLFFKKIGIKNSDEKRQRKKEDGKKKKSTCNQPK